MEWADLRAIALGLSGVGLAVGLAALVILNPAAGLKLASQAAGLVLDGARRGVAWARDPARDWWKIGCLSFSALFAVAAVVANDRHGAAVEAETQYAELAKHDAALAKKLEAETLRADELAARLAIEVGKQQEVERLNRDAVARAKAQAAKAAQDAADWRRRYNDRPDTCKAAQAALEDACGTLSDY